MLVLRLTSCLAFLIHLNQIVSLPNGAPESTCSTLLPIHGGGIPPEATQSLFQVIPQASVVGQGQILRIEIPSDIPQLSFKGFMIHARASNGRVVGRFASSADGLVKLINCDGAQNTATHANTNPKIDFGLDWQAPTDYLGDIIFKYERFHFC
jgi:Reeler domain